MRVPKSLLQMKIVLLLISSKILFFLIKFASRTFDPAGILKNLKTANRVNA